MSISLGSVGCMGLPFTLAVFYEMVTTPPKPKPHHIHLRNGTIINTMPFERVSKVAEAELPTRWGQFRIHGFEGLVANPEPCNEALPAPAKRIEGVVALVHGDVFSAPPLVRVHSQCLTGDVFHSLRCDCRLQLELAMSMIIEAGAGILIYAGASSARRPA